MLPLISRIIVPPVVVLIALGIYRLVAISAPPSAPTVRPPTTAATAERTKPYVIRPTNIEPRVATPDQLRQVLARVVPPVDPVNTNNFVHALRLWGAEARFDDPRLPSGEDMRNYLLDDRVYRKWAGEKTPALFVREADGVRVRDFDDIYPQRTTASFHNEDILATLAETGTPLDAPLHMRDGEATVEELLDDSLRRFHVDRWEFEWSFISYLRYRYPLREWTNSDGVKIKLGELIQMCVPGRIEQANVGPCLGQHRLEALVVLLKIDEEVHCLAPPSRQSIVNYLKLCSDRLVASQSEQGYWTTRWVEGAEGKSNDKASADEKLLVTGHTLEWLALAPEEVLPPRENIVRAGQWLVKEVTGLDEKTLVDHYGPYSHAARALCLWQGKEAWDVWKDLPPAEKTDPAPPAE